MVNATRLSEAEVMVAKIVPAPYSHSFSFGYAVEPDHVIETDGDIKMRSEERRLIYGLVISAAVVVVVAVMAALS